MAQALAHSRRLPVSGWFRVGLRVVAMAALLALCVPLYYFWRLVAPHANPWPRLFLTGIGRIAGVRIRRRGTPVPGRSFVLANHVSWIDIPALAATRGAAFVGHDGLASIPLVRWLCRMNDTVFVARHDRTSVAEQVEQVRTALSEMHALAIFPEGTTSDGTGLLPFKSSLLSALDPLAPGVTVQPVLLDYGREAADVAWVGEEHGVDNFCRILARARPLDLTVVFLPPLTGEALASRKTIAAAARAALLAELSG